MQKVRTTGVLIADEHPVIRWGLRHFLETQRDLRVLGEADTLAETLELANRFAPDVIIMDLLLPDNDTAQATRRAVHESGARVLAFSARDTWDCVEKFMGQGGAGFVTKRCSPEELVAAVRAVAAGRQWISPDIRKSSAPSGQTKSAVVLSPRECEVAALVARGFTSRQIADQLCLSLKTVETHRYRIFKELHIKSRAELVSYVMEHDLLHPTERRPTITTRRMLSSTKTD